ncbi:hypothetical protein HKCCE4037_06455 [Rhodobacterales bacterium HKCCE4037]|nr:hypothetical protein [Rhodobacterales bacterium HKCCE4037]
MATKSNKTKKSEVTVRLLCVYSGKDRTWDPGEEISVDAEEAERLVGIGAAELVEG